MKQASHQEPVGFTFFVRMKLEVCVAWGCHVFFVVSRIGCL